MQRKGQNRTHIRTYRQIDLDSPKKETFAITMMDDLPDLIFLQEHSHIPTACVFRSRKKQIPKNGKNAGTCSRVI